MSARRYRILYHHRIRAEDGQAMHVRELVGALRDEGHEVVECALVKKTAEPAATSSLPSGKPLAAVQRRKRASFWERVRLPRLGVEAMEIAYNQKGIQLLRRAVATHRPHFIYERHALHLYAGATVAREHGIPLLLEVNSPMYDEMTRLQMLRFPRRAQRVEQRVLAAADRVFPVSGVLCDWLVHRGARKERCRVIGNGAVPERYDPTAHAAGRALRAELGIADDEFVLGFVGFMRDWHRLEYAVDALVRAELRNTRLLLVGDGPALPGVLARARAAGVASRVIALGPRKPQLVPHAVTAFDAGTIPAINPYSSPLKLFDYFAAGVPVLAPAQANVQEVVVDRHNGMLFSQDDAASFAARLIELATDRDLAGRLGRAGRADLLDHDWTWRGNAKRVVAAFEELNRV